jgi:very-short-patch-repair endonuclease
MARCQSPERVFAAADSALRTRLLTRRQWRRAIRALPLRLQALLDDADGVAESITESVALFRLRRLGLHPRQQVAIAGVGTVDFLLGDRLVIEVDGRAFHNDENRFENDRRRDARLSARGYRVLRFSYTQVFERWSEVRAAILGALARCDHLA